eukprot:scaffold18754_cov155-Skeletonema_dohrnii-CCMP3373.AAC.4
MERCEVPPNWEDLCRSSYESAKDESVADAIKYLTLTSQTGPVHLNQRLRLAHCPPQLMMLPRTLCRTLLP